MKLRYVNPLGKELTLDTWPKRKDYLLQNWEGFGEVPVSLQTRKSPYQDGVTVMEQLLEPRHLSLEVVLLGESKQDVYDKRRFIQSLFNPKLGQGRLEWYQPDGTVYSIGVIPDGSPNFPGGEARTGFSQITTIDLIAPDPMWEDVEATKLTLSSVIGMFKFPLVLPTEMGVLDNKGIVVNGGDVATPVEIVFYGPVANPVIKNETTGEYIRVNRVLPDGYSLIIDTAFGSKKITLVDDEGNKSNAFGSIDLGSQLWWLAIGDNEITYESDSGGTTRVTIAFKQRYVGV